VRSREGFLVNRSVASESASSTTTFACLPLDLLSFEDGVMERGSIGRSGWSWELLECLLVFRLIFRVLLFLGRVEMRGLEGVLVGLVLRYREMGRW
jgi:hypothetical protein